MEAGRTVRKDKESSQAKEKVAYFLMRNKRHIAESIDYFGGHKLSSIFICFLIAVTLALPSGCLIFKYYLTSLGKVWNGEPSIGVFMKPYVSDAEGKQFFDTLDMHHLVDSVKIIWPNEALEEILSFDDQNLLKKYFNERQANPLPMSAWIKLKNALDTDAVEQFKRHVQDDSKVDRIVFQHEWMQRLSLLYSTIDRVILLLFIVFAISVFLTVATSIRFIFNEKLSEIMVLKVFGASDNYIRMPFIYLGVIYGFISAALATLFLGVAFQYLEIDLTPLLQSYQGEQVTLEVDGVWIAVLFTSSIGICSLGSLFANFRRI